MRGRHISHACTSPDPSTVWCTGVFLRESMQRGDSNQQDDRVSRLNTTAIGKKIVRVDASRATFMTPFGQSL